jgi:CHAT domain-containing protein
MFEAMEEKPNMALVLSSMASAYELQGNHQKAMEFAERASEISRQIGKMFTYQEALTTAGSAALALKQPARARKAFEEAISTIESLREQVAGGEQERGRFFENRVSPYQEMVKLLLSENNPSEALRFAERAKGRVLLDVLRSGRVDISKTMTPGEREREQLLRAALYSLNSQVAREGQRTVPDKALLDSLRARLRQARLDLEGFENSLYSAHPELKVQRGEAAAIRIEEAGAAIPDASTALLEYVVNADRTFLFVLTRSKDGGPKINLQSYAINVGEKEIARRAESFRQQIAGRDFAFGKDAKELFDLLIGPAAKQLEGAKSLIIVPDRALWNLPFQALRTARDSYVLEDYAVSYAPSVSVLTEMMKTRKLPRNSPNSSTTLLALGNPSVGEKILQRAKTGLMDESLEPLPEAERQVTELSRIYGVGQSKVYTGSGATEDRLKAEAGVYRVLQLAAHGILNDSNPMYSHIVLSQANERNEDGLLEAWEMMNLNLKADMVVLSACETARGRIGAGEGVIGMSWALFIAGSPTTVVSQWKVDSASTTELMLEFHRLIKAGMQNPKALMTKSEALRQSALKLMKTADYRHPFYWAGFVVIGDAR